MGSELRAGMGASGGKVPAALDGGVYPSGKDRELCDPAPEYDGPCRFRRTLLWTVGSRAVFAGGRFVGGTSRSRMVRRCLRVAEDWDGRFAPRCSGYST